MLANKSENKTRHSHLWTGVRGSLRHSMLLCCRALARVLSLTDCRVKVFTQGCICAFVWGNFISCRVNRRTISVLFFFFWASSSTQPGASSDAVFTFISFISDVLLSPNF